MKNELKTLLRGVMQIDAADWEKAEDDTLSMKVRDPYGNIVRCSLKLLSEYSDKGHVELVIDGLPKGVDGQDFTPRPFFSYEEANHHCRTFLKWRLWKHRVYDHGWGDLRAHGIRDHKPDEQIAAE